MPGIIQPEVEEYLSSVLPPRDQILAEMEETAKARDIPIVGPAVGRLLYQLGKMARARNVFEMGSAIGYSTIWWARSIASGGKVIYTDGDKRNADEAKINFAKAGVSDRIDVRVGDALEILSEQRPDSFDVIFNDIDKEDYPRVLQLATPRLRKGGIFVTDNVLWSGRVARSDVEGDARTSAIARFNKMLCESPEYFTTVIPLRDGVAVALKL